MCITVADYEKSKSFYEAVLPSIGYGLIMEYGKSAGFGAQGKPSFWVGEGAPGPYWTEHHEVGKSPIHVAFTAASRPAVDEFHRVALAAGAKDYGGPGVREIYHPHYYGAFVIDPDGNNIEAVCHLPSDA